MKKNTILLIIIASFMVLVYAAVSEVFKLSNDNYTDNTKNYGLFINPNPKENGYSWIKNILSSNKNDDKPSLPQKSKKAVKQHRSIDSKIPDAFSGLKQNNRNFNGGEGLEKQTSSYRYEHKRSKNYENDDLASNTGSSNFVIFLRNKNGDRVNNDNITPTGSLYANDLTSPMQKTTNDFGGGTDDGFGGGSGTDNGDAYNDVPVGNGLLPLLFIVSIYIMLLGFKLQLKKRKKHIQTDIKFES